MMGNEATGSMQYYLCLLIVYNAQDMALYTIFKPKYLGTGQA